MIKYIAFLGGLLSFSITCSFASFSKNVTVYTGNKASVNCEYDFYNDKLRILSIAEITRLPEDSFRILPQELRRTTPHQIYWLRFKIVNTSTQRLVLRTPRQYRICELYIPEGTGLVKKIFNIHQWWGENPFILNYPAFDLPITNNDRYYYLRVSSDEVTGLGFKVCDYGFFYSETIKKFTWFLLFFGIMLLALLYTAIFWLRIKDKVFFYYFLFLVSLIIFNLMIKGALNPLFENITFHYYYFTIPFAGMTVFLLLYIRKALALNDQFSRYNKVINYLIYLRLIILVVSIVLNNEWLLGDHVDLILLIPAYIIVFRFYKRSPKDYSYLFYSINIIFIAYTVRLLRIFYRDSDFFGMNGSDFEILFLILTSLEVVFLSFNLTEKYLNLKREKDLKHQETLKLHQAALSERLEKQSVIEQMNVKLESLVKNRTEELNIALQKLEKQTENIEEMNLKLKRNNEKLSEYVKNVNQARLLDKNISYEEFSVLFPDEYQCQTFIASLKWEKGFVCKKCGYKRYYENYAANSRKCRICQHVESATSNTIFENVKFSLQKAIYILYYVFSHPAPNIKKLSEAIELREGTCLNFYKKICVQKEKFKPSTLSKMDWTQFMLIGPELKT